MENILANLPAIGAAVLASLIAVRLWLKVAKKDDLASKVKGIEDTLEKIGAKKE